jgi:hypothetical protein
MRTTLPRVAAVAAAFLLMACGPSKSSSTDGASPSGSQTGNSAGKKASCSLAPASLVNASLGTHVGEAKAQELGIVVVCRYEPTPGNTGNVIVRFQSKTTSALFTESRAVSDRSGLTTSDFPGFVDDAYTNVIAIGSHVTNTLVARKGDMQILVSSPASFDAERSLEQKLFDALG